MNQNALITYGDCVMENKNKTPNQQKKIRKSIIRPIVSREYINEEQEVYTSWLNKLSEYLRSDKDLNESNLLYVEPNIYI